jgi:hypothetical protein
LAGAPALRVLITPQCGITLRASQKAAQLLPADFLTDSRGGAVACSALFASERGRRTMNDGLAIATSLAICVGLGIVLGWGAGLASGMAISAAMIVTRYG